MRLANVENTLTTEEWKAILEYFNHRCAYCRRAGLKLTKDHVIAIVRGGGHTAENVVPACQRCNSMKSSGLVFVMLRKVA